MKRNWKTHYNIVIANFLLVLAIGINLVIYKIVTDLQAGIINPYILLASPLIGVIISIILYYFDLQYFVADYPYKKFYFDKKYTKFYLIGLAIFAFEILVLITLIVGIVIHFTRSLNDSGGFTYLATWKTKRIGEYTDSDRTIASTTNILRILLWISLAIATIIGVISLGFIKYSRLKIDTQLLIHERKKETEVALSDQNQNINADNTAVIIDLDASETRKKSDKQSPKTKKEEPELPSAGLSSI